MEKIYINLTGGAIHQVLETINLSCIKDSYVEYRFKIPRTCFKNVYPITERFICSKPNKISFEVLQYSPAYYFKINNNLLKIYDCNTSEKITYIIILTDDELKKLNTILPLFRPCISYVSPDF